MCFLFVVYNFNFFHVGHRFGNFQNIRRISQKKRYIKSGMMTHLTHSDVDSVHSFKPHIHIDMEDDQIQLAPKEV